jgi:transposase
MPLILAPSFDDHAREEIEEFLDVVRIRRVAGALEFRESRLSKLHAENSSLAQRLVRNWDQLGKCLARIDADIEKAEAYLNTCEALKTELDMVTERIFIAKT